MYKYSETDDTLADLADSDFGNGGTNRKGHIMWAAYNFTKYLQAKTKYFITEVVNETFSHVLALAAIVIGLAIGWRRADSIALTAT